MYNNCGLGPFNSPSISNLNFQKQIGSSPPSIPFSSPSSSSCPSLACFPLPSSLSCLQSVLPQICFLSLKLLKTLKRHKKLLCLALAFSKDPSNFGILLLQLLRPSLLALSKG